MPVRNRPDDVLRAERRIAAEEHVRHRRLQRCLVEHRHARLVERDAAVAFDPRESVFLADRDQHFVALVNHFRLAGGLQRTAAFVVVLRLDLLEAHSGQAAVVVQERFGHQIVQDRDAFVHRVLFSHGDAFISSKPERTITLTSSPPRRLDVRQQSIAVLPPPSTITRLPIR